MIEVRNLTFSYSRKKAPVLNNLSVTIERGKVCGLLGKNGAGKSTLLYLVAGLLTPQNGTVLFNGKSTRDRDPETLQDIFIVPEEFNLPSISLKEYVKINAPLYPRFNNEDLEKYLKMFEMDNDFNLGALSMGQKKKAYMAFALATNTSLLLMDEPTNGLDIPGKSQFRKFIAAGMSDERNIIISTHQVRDIDQLLDHIILINDNEILLNHSTTEITEKLIFKNTDDPQIIASALHAQFSMYGNSVILPNNENAESELNLETLFNFAIEKPQLIKQTFNQSTQTES